jgi:glutamyl-tRNA synthetase
MSYAIAGGLFGPAGAGSTGGPADADQRAAFVAAMPLIKERLTFLHEVPGKLAYLFSEPAVPAAEEFIPKKLDLAAARRYLAIGRSLTSAMASQTDEEAEAAIRAAAEAAGAKMGDLMMPLRVAITGARVSPPLFGSVRILGAKRSLARVDRALAALDHVSGADGA